VTRTPLFREDENERGQVDGDVLAGPDLGGFLTLSLWAKNRSLMDDRGTLLGEAFFKQYFAARETPEGFVAVARGLHAPYIFLPAASKLSSSIAGCGKLCGDEQAVVCQIGERDHPEQRNGGDVRGNKGGNAEQEARRDERQRKPAQPAGSTDCLGLVISVALQRGHEP
jgi:hypothetical protein